MKTMKDHTSFEINTYLLNSIIIQFNSKSHYKAAVNIFKWMCDNTPQHHRPNSSTYNMMLLVYGSMKEFMKA